VLKKENCVPGNAAAAEECCEYIEQVICSSEDGMGYEIFVLRDELFSC